MGMSYSAPGRMVAHNMVTTQFELDGFRVVRTLGVVRGIVVRSRSIFGTIGAGLQTILGGNITLLSQLCEKTRGDAYELMIQHATEMGANAISRPQTQRDLPRMSAQVKGSPFDSVRR